MPFQEDAINSLTWSKTNKVGVNNDEQKQGVVSDLLPELTLETDDAQLMSLSLKWMKEWEKFKEKESIEKRWTQAEDYWKGKQKIQQREYKDQPVADNLIFEALETFLPIATRQNPEPVITSLINSPESEEFNNLLKEQIVSITDAVRLRLKIKRATRHWALSLVGIVKMGWDADKNIPTPYVLRPQKAILDPNSTIEEGQYTGAFVGEYKEATAEALIAQFPEKADFIKETVKNELGTKVRFIEWWTNKMSFWTLDKEVLGKMKNPHWDYGEDMQSSVDDFGQPMEVAIPAFNHFMSPRMPYCFLSVFNLGKSPLDDTGLIEQNIPMQNRIVKLNTQIDKNVDGMNGSIAISSDVFNKDQAKSAADAKRDGRPILVPGDPRAAILDLMPPGIPADVFNHRNDMRNELRGVFGVTGATAQGIASEDTVRGKILAREQDSSRIGGGVSVFIEQLADDIFNWLVQMIYVYFGPEDYARILGDEKGMRFAELLQVFGQKQLTVSVKEGSLIPKDSLTQRNEAVDLFTAGALDPVTLFEKLDFPDPQESANRLMMWKQGQLAGMGGEMAAPVAPMQPDTSQPEIPGVAPGQDPLTAVPIG